MDGKNVTGSYSALAVFETGSPFCGGFYLLPQYRLALDIRQGDVNNAHGATCQPFTRPNWELFIPLKCCLIAGIVLYHRGVDPVVGVHGNRGLGLPDGSAHRIALVLYQTQLGDKADAPLRGDGDGDRWRNHPV